MAWLSLGLELLDNLSELTIDVVVEVLLWDGEVKLLLKRDHHAAEVLANKVLEELGAGIALWLSISFEDLVGKIGASLKGEFFAQDEGVIAVKENLLDLPAVSD